MTGGKGAASGPKRSRTPLHSLRKKCRVLDVQKLQKARLKQLYRALKKAKQFEIRKIKRRMKEESEPDKLQRQLDIAKALNLATLTNELAGEAGWQARMPPAGKADAEARPTERSAIEQIVHDRVKRCRIVQDEVFAHASFVLIERPDGPLSGQLALAVVKQSPQQSTYTGRQLRLAFELLSKATGQPPPPSASKPHDADAHEQADPQTPKAGLRSDHRESVASDMAESDADLEAAAAAAAALDEQLVGAPVLPDSSSDGEEAAAPPEALEAMRRASSVGQQVDDESFTSTAGSEHSEDSATSAEQAPAPRSKRQRDYAQFATTQARGDAIAKNLPGRQKKRHAGDLSGASKQSKQQTETRKPSKRLGQRARRKLYERQYGLEANHLQRSSKAQARGPPAPQQVPTELKNDASEAPTHPSWAAKQAQQKQLSAAPRGKKVVFGEGPDGSAVAVTTRDSATLSVTESEITGFTAISKAQASAWPHAAQRKGVLKASSKDANLHPSWLAAKRRQEEQAKQTALLTKPVGTKVVFAD